MFAGLLVWCSLLLTEKDGLLDSKVPERRQEGHGARPQQMQTNDQIDSSRLPCHLGCSTFSGSHYQHLEQESVSGSVGSPVLKARAKLTVQSSTKIE